MTVITAIIIVIAVIVIVIVITTLQFLCSFLNSTTSIFISAPLLTLSPAGFPISNFHFRWCLIFNLLLSTSPSTSTISFPASSNHSQHFPYHPHCYCCGYYYYYYYYYCYCFDWLFLQQVPHVYFHSSDFANHQYLSLRHYHYHHHHHQLHHYHQFL
ncbi:conserved hypothetical protein [Lodderomyces elongisporus NRRL YB-4239]|uniref:Uncharacterized protein n=1 Tax=Lodderomyces elongisporus (strain ATCC 11503 / CBS 2605 / JCM 1781 / NBRC 1676 / NRRL YB-4239) TaxID=379508 RepID=A5DYD8_LODEL|nr:conserved hypothetical protein [Lodderomyces elongisporus NRRL YB-4239]